MAYRPSRDARVTLDPAKAARDKPKAARPAPPAILLRSRQASAITFVRGLSPDAVTHSDNPTFAEISFKALRAVARCYHFVLDNLASRCETETDFFSYDDWHSALMHARRRKSMGPQGDRMDLLQQLVHLDDNLDRKLCARLLAVTHGHNHAKCRDLHDKATPQEDAFHRLLHILPVLLTANYLTDKAKVKTISEISQGNCEHFQLSQWEALYADHQDKAAKRLAILTARSGKADTQRTRAQVLSGGLKSTPESTSQVKPVRPSRPKAWWSPKQHMRQGKA
jgi:hypothetical protein